MCIVYGLLSAVFAALTSILAKVGMENVNSNLATAIRTIVVLVMAWIVVGVTKTAGGIGNFKSCTTFYQNINRNRTHYTWDACDCPLSVSYF